MASSPRPTCNCSQFSVPPSNGRYPYEMQCNVPDEFGLKIEQLMVFVVSVVQGKFPKVTLGPLPIACPEFAGIAVRDDLIPYLGMK